MLGHNTGSNPQRVMSICTRWHSGETLAGNTRRVGTCDATRYLAPKAPAMVPLASKTMAPCDGSSSRQTCPQSRQEHSISVEIASSIRRRTVLVEKQTGQDELSSSAGNTGWEVYTGWVSESRRQARAAINRAKSETTQSQIGSAIPFSLDGGNDERGRHDE